MTAYYNEIDPFDAAWLRNLIEKRLIAPGDVDERSIEDVRPNDLTGYTQCHFFAGIGVWSYALRLAGWPDDRPVWTGSCPCQPFSAAGKGAGFADERHLWPAFHWLIGQCRPPVVFGEQVASKDGLAWLDLVQADLEGTGYASEADDLCVAGVGAPHIRQRLYWVADTNSSASGQRGSFSGRSDEWKQFPAGGQRSAFGLAHPDRHGCATLPFDRGAARERDVEPCGQSSVLANSDGGNASTAGLQRNRKHGQQPQTGYVGCIERPGPVNGFWRDADWIFCRDGKWRPIEPGTFPLAHGAPSRVGRLRAYGNAISPWAAKVFIDAKRVRLNEMYTLTNDVFS